MIEEAARFGEGNSLIGVVTDPPRTHQARPLHGVILLNPGIVHRVGPGRIYVQIARALAVKGFVALRFDFSGIGDSGIRHDQLPFEKSAVSETREAMNFLKMTRGIDRFIVLGGCSGATIALRTAVCDPRVRHAILINFPIAANEEDDATPQQLSRIKAHYYWKYALFHATSWRKLLTGSADYRRIIQTLGFQSRRWFARVAKPRPNDTPFASELLQLTTSGASLTFVCSQGDRTLFDLREAGGRELRRLCARGAVGMEIIPRSDHTFSSLQDQQKLLKAVVDRVRKVTSEHISHLRNPIQERVIEAASPV